MYLDTLGAVLYRAGRHEEAIERFEESISAYGREGEVLDWILLALAHQRLNQTAESQRWFDNAIIWIAEKTALDVAIFSWQIRLECQLLCDEAEALLSEAVSESVASAGGALGEI